MNRERHPKLSSKVGFPMKNRRKKKYVFLIVVCSIVVALVSIYADRFLIEKNWPSFLAIRTETLPRAKEIKSDDLLLSVRLHASLGIDLGQSLGTIFEARDADGIVFCAAGFNNGYQTRRTLSRRVVEFFCRDPTSKDLDFEITDLGQTSPQSARTEILLAGRTLVDLMSESEYVHGKVWRPFNIGSMKIRSRIVNIQYVQGKPLIFTYASRVFYDGKLVADLGGRLRSSLYYNARIFVATHESDNRETIKWCDWRPTLTTQRMCGPVHTLLRPLGGDVYSMIGWRGRVFAAGGYSALYEVIDDKINIIYSEKAGEFYGMIEFGNQFFIGHYPSGYLYVFDGINVTRQVVPPLRPGQWQGSRGELYREAQTLAIYAGQLVVGVYPWGHVWRLDPRSGKWRFIRVFDRPAFSDEAYPYRREVSSRMEELAGDERLKQHKWLFETMWSQRVTSLVPFSNSLAAGLGNMSGFPREPERDNFLTESEWRQYGKVKILSLPNIVSGQINWPQNETTFEFLVMKEDLEIRQDGFLIASGPSNLDEEGISKISNITIGTGLYGRSEITWMKAQ